MLNYWPSMTFYHYRTFLVGMQANMFDPCAAINSNDMMRPKGQDPAMWNRLFIVIFLQISSRGFFTDFFLAAICTGGPQEIHRCNQLRLVVLCYNVSHLVLDFCPSTMWICMNPMMKLHVPQTKARPATQSKILSPSAGCLWICLCCLWNRQGW